MQVINLIKRNMLLYIRDKGALAFSFLTMIIVIVLMLLFLGEMNVNDLIEFADEFKVSIERTNAEKMMGMWTAGGILTVNSLMISLTVIGFMINDRENKRLHSLLVSPISRLKLSLGYIFSSWICSFLVCIITLVISEMIFGIWLNAIENVKILLMIACNTYFYSTLMYLIAIFVKSSSAWSGMGTVIGTVSGFLGAIYLPMGALPSAVQTFLKFTPLLHSSSIFRRICTDAISTQIFTDIPEKAVDEYKKAMGIIVYADDNIISMWAQLAFIVVCGIILTLVSVVITKKRSLND